MPGRGERFHRIPVEAFLDPQRCRLLAPGAPEQPARRAHRRLRVHAVGDDAAVERRLRLRLPFPAHRAERHRSAVGEPRERRVEGVERLASGRQPVGTAVGETHAGAAILPDQPGLRQHQARAELPVKALDEADRPPRLVDRAHPDGVAVGPGRRPGGGRPAVDAARGLVERSRRQPVRRVDFHRRGVAEMRVAQDKGLLGRLDDPVDMGESLRFLALQAEPVDQPQDHQRGRALGRRRHVVDRAGREIDGQRGAPERTVAGQVVGVHRRAHRLEFGGDAPREHAPVEAVQPVAREGAQRFAKRRIAEPAAGRRCRAADQERLREARDRGQLVRLERRGPGLIVACRKSGLREPHRVFEQPFERHPPAPLRGDRERGVPSRYRAGDGVGGERAARRNRRGAGIKRRRRGRTRRTAGVYPDRIGARRGDQPEAVAAEPVHVGVDDRDGGGRGHRRLDRVAAFPQHREPGRCREPVRGDHHPANAVGRPQHRAAPARE